MSTEVVMPQMGESIAEGTITKWLKKIGERVERDEPLFEISTDKVDAEIPSPAAGTLTEVRFNEGDTVEVNTVVAVLDGNSAAAATEPAPKPIEALNAQQFGESLHAADNANSGSGNDPSSKDSNDPAFIGPMLEDILGPQGADDKQTPKPLVIDSNAPPPVPPPLPFKFDNPGNTQK